MSTAPFDPRFPNANQTKSCWLHYADYHKCLAIKGEDYEPCNYFKKVYKALCDITTIDKFEEMRENGTFPIRK
ncbi:hypothetical protein CAPTEDRAFT_135062 [Capitella teleta]|uniref:Cytochrome c oxidase subunit 6B1 n=1 Tax=Capitella teleta TaxID=283909 RepID=R7UJN4_CAPTE|nr:hypothetical protein CAPTEDRAFT_135062 [Capitella teleta]|eukprot:ELU03452.1 hypothetical protein CAPTEDRAFT_135062 [Capitella teleta]